MQELLTLVGGEAFFLNESPGAGIFLNEVNRMKRLLGFLLLLGLIVLFGCVSEEDLEAELESFSPEEIEEMRIAEEGGYVGRAYFPSKTKAPAKSLIEKYDSRSYLSCKDSDGGIYPDTRGEAVSLYYYPPDSTKQKKEIVTDKCQGNIVKEAFCNIKNKKPSSQDISPGGTFNKCMDGVGINVCEPETVENGVVSGYPECEITCNSGYHLVDKTCVPYVCVGEILRNAELCLGDGQGLTADTAISLRADCFSDDKCEYVCLRDFIYRRRHPVSGNPFCARRDCPYRRVDDGEGNCVCDNLDLVNDEESGVTYVDPGTCSVICHGEEKDYYTYDDQQRKCIHSCVDSDGGIDPLVGGNSYSDFERKDDRCPDPFHNFILYESYCKGGSPELEEVDCGTLGKRCLRDPNSGWGKCGDIIFCNNPTQPYWNGINSCQASCYGAAVPPNQPVPCDQLTAAQIRQRLGIS